MNEDLQSIHLLLRQAGARRRLSRAHHGFWRGCIAGCALFLTVLAAYKLFPVPREWVTYAGVGGAACAIAGWLIGGWRRDSIAQTARWVDSQRHLQERLGTALEVAGAPTSHEWRSMIVQDAAAAARDITARELLPWRLPRSSRWAMLVAVVALCVAFVPEYRSPVAKKKQSDETQIRQTGKEMAELIRQNIEQRAGLLEPTQAAMEAAAELGEKLSVAPPSKADALRDLARLTDKIAEQARTLTEKVAPPSLERAARQSSAGTTSSAEAQKQIDALQKALGPTPPKPESMDELQKKLGEAQQAMGKMGNPESAEGAAAREKLAQSLSDMAREARELGASLPGLEEAIAAMQAGQIDLASRELQTAFNELEKMKDMAQALQQLQQQGSELGKDLGERLSHGQVQAAKESIEKMIEKLRAADLSNESLDKIADEVARAIDPAGEYGEVAKHLAEALKGMKSGDKPGAGQALAQAAKELDEMLKNLAEAGDLAATLDALQRGQLALANDKAFSQCLGTGFGACLTPRSGRGGRPGRGVGTWADDDTGWIAVQDTSGWDNSNLPHPDQTSRGHTDRGEGEVKDELVPTKVRGQLSPGKAMPSITLKGVSIKGQSSVSYEEAAATAQTEAQNALNQDQVPRAYQGAVRDYFDDLKQ